MKYIRTSRHGQAESAKQIDQTDAPKPISPDEDDLEKHLMEKRLARFRSNWYEHAARPARTQKS